MSQRDEALPDKEPLNFGLEYVEIIPGFPDTSGNRLLVGDPLLI